MKNFIARKQHAKIETPTSEVGFEACFLRYHDDLCLRVTCYRKVDFKHVDQVDQDQEKDDREVRHIARRPRASAPGLSSNYTRWDMVLANRVI